MEKQREPQSVKLIGNIRVEEGEHATHVVQTVYLQRGSRCEQKYLTHIDPTKDNHEHAHL